MAFTWLPDYADDPHPRLTWFTECCFDFAVRALYRKEEMLPRDYRLDPGTLIVSNHQRDADIPILTTVLCRRKGMHILYPLPFYASREDFFRRGFLSAHLDGWPRPLRALLGRISLAWFFRIVRAEPMRRVPEFTLAEALTEIPSAAGDSIERWLNERGRREELPREGPVRARGGPAGHWGLRRIHTAAHAALGPGFRETVESQLTRFAELLDAGRTVYFAPEGTISHNGRFGRIRAGTWLIARLTASPPPLLPLALSYDPLSPGRLRVVIHVGDYLRVYDTRERMPFDAMLREEIGKLFPVNASHLIARFLAMGPTGFVATDLARWLEKARTAIATAGLTLDPLLDHEEPKALAASRLAWLARKRLIVRDGERCGNRWSSATAPGWRSPGAMVAYSANALDDVLRARAPGLARDLKP